MTAQLLIRKTGPAVSLQDLGRPGFIAQGLSRGGAMDRLALHEGAALLQRPVRAALEMIGSGGTFEVTADTRIALTGAPMQARIGDTALAWNASHLLPAGEVLTIGGTIEGAIGYLHLGDGFDLPPLMGALSAHNAAGIGYPVVEGEALPLRPDTGTQTGLQLPHDPRFDGGTVHVTRSLQSPLFGENALYRLTQTPFMRDARANRQGIRLNPDGAGFAAEGGLTVVSEVIAPGDIQITGDGAAYVLMCESQTTGGYPRIATTLPGDLPRVAQAPTGATIRLVLLDREAAITREKAARAHIKALPGLCQPLIRDPATLRDLLSYTLVSGAVSALADPFEGDMP
ncbi:urea amidolyase [Aliishimia ponticola]|uniref:Urea amidolyase n=1 Tax=Aliishimia ponticola TaxID=2499833 RepID=A0A4S4NBS8_9RHOB|nr:biotin-dependent carboxyltransferase family protein [Aliishimia ponticola]THH36876.1 urea amidolyase [Aliishimia ponticola]